MLEIKYVQCDRIARRIILKGDDNPIITIFYMKDLDKP